MMRDVRICFVGDSLVAGLGDRRCLGWAGRLAVRAIGAGLPVTYYNLGVRRQTSTEIARRWFPECESRFPAGVDARVVLSFGVNDTLLEDGRTRVASEDSAANLSAILRGARERGWPTLVVAPPPVNDDEHNARTEKLAVRFAEVCEAEEVPYVRVHRPLRDNATWMSEVAAGDGYHPSAAGYDELEALIASHWLQWLTEPGSGLPDVR
ncbi:GDSL-type esterase/lipase family protein [Nocardia terpenica]|uniref:G-D-S-L family lipolytic protein n=1 Tax=Nocardia terpenica TaxID=455432 RepID=A0A291RUQ7_9NOCA|nr:GDSL-type esterase/lipase family protein [Nocardia terpenica]ATL71266.1 G-D-S-L family lipolytic protein [Nocardia terpenica]